MGDNLIYSQVVRIVNIPYVPLAAIPHPTHGAPAAY